jgi:hypothetical protein
MAQIKQVTVIHPKYGEILNESFLDEVQFKIFLTMLHSSLEMEQKLTSFNGKDFLIHIPKDILKECLIIGNTKEVSMAEVVSAKSKIES